MQAGILGAEGLTDRIAKLARRAGEATQRLAELRLSSDTFFEGATALLSSSDQQIASRLRQVYGDRGWQSRMNDAIANQMRFNEVLRQTGSILENNLTTGIADVVTGTKTLKEGFADTARVVVRALEEMVIKLLIIRPLMQGLSSLFGGGILGGGGGLLAGIGHSGGVVGALSSASYMHPAYFAGAPSFAAGLGARAPGINEVPVLAHRGEVIGWPDQMRRAFGGGSVVTVAPTIQVSMPPGADPGSGRNFGDAAGSAFMSKIIPMIKAVSRQVILDETRDSGVLTRSR